MRGIERYHAIRTRPLQAALVMFAAALLIMGVLADNAKAVTTDLGKSGPVTAALNTGTTGNNTFTGSSSASLTASSVCPLNGGVCSGTLTSMVGSRIPFATTLTNLYGFQANAPASGSSCSVIVRTSAGGTAAYSSTSLSCTIAAGSKTCSNTSATVNVNAGDSVQVEFVNSGTCSGYVDWGLAGAYRT